jgi:hypothetical protein
VGRIEAGWHLAKLSLRVVQRDGSLSVLVVLGGIASGAVALAFFAPAAVAYSIEETWLAAVIGFVGVYLATVVATYFAVGLAAAAAEVLDGRDATVRGGLAVAGRNVGRRRDRAARRRSPDRGRGRSTRERGASRVRGRALPPRGGQRRDGPVLRARSRAGRRQEGMRT